MVLKLQLLVSAKKKLLWIDDEPNILKSYQRALRGEAYEVLVASTADEAMKLMSAHAFQLVISDFRMPGLNGLDVLKKVKEQDPKAVRVILSGYADESAIEMALKEGEVMKYLLKPIDNKNVRDEIDALFKIYEAKNAL